MKLHIHGVHVPNRKNTAELAALRLPIPETVEIPMSMHIGAPAIPVVKPGESVRVGQLIGKAGGFVSAPVYASVSGTVKKIGQQVGSGGRLMQTVVIAADGKQEPDPDLKPPKLDTMQDFLDAVRESGMVGLGGAGFPTVVKLTVKNLEQVRAVIINGAECEPYITADDRLCREKPQDVISGLKLIMKIFGLKEGHIGIEDNKPQAIEALKEAAKDETGILIDVLPAKYPQGAEKQLIYAVTGREVPSGGLPAALGCAVFNAATTRAIHDVVYDGMPLIKRIVTVSGDILMEPKNLLVPIGTSFNDLLDACGHSENPYKVLSGGPMMGVAQYDLSVPTIKGVNAVTVLGKKNNFFVDEPHCLRCGKCIEVCPMHLMPVLMYQAIQDGDVDGMKSVNLLDCIECGCCSFVCPAKRPLTQEIKSMRKIQLAKRKK